MKFPAPPSPTLPDRSGGKGHHSHSLPADIKGGDPGAGDDAIDLRVQEMLSGDC